MKKGEKLLTVEITEGRICAKNTDGSYVKLSRTERNVLSNYKKPDYIANIKKIFGNPEIIADGFTVVKNGITKFTYTK